MDKSLLKKAAIQCVALMMAVITSSFALSQYQAVPIEALSQVKNHSSEADMASLVVTTDNWDRNGSISNLTNEHNLTFGVDENILKQLGDNYLIIKKPIGDQPKLSLDDLYINKSIELTLSGIADDNYTSNMISRVRGDETFNGDPKYTETTTTETDEDGTTKEVVTKDYGNDLVHNITINRDNDHNTQKNILKIMIELDSVYVYTVYEDQDNFFIKLQKPSDVYDKIVVIDAGHGGKDGGASSRDKSFLEKNLNLEIAMELKKLLDQENIKVYYTRTKDETVYLRPRVELANSVDCDYFISIHCNANEASYPNGSEVLYYNNNFKEVRNLDLAKLFSKELGESIPLSNKGIVERHVNDLYIMDKSIVPMILIEVGYITNTKDLNYLCKEENRKAVAQGIYHGIMKAYKELPVKNN